MIDEEEPYKEGAIEIHDIQHVYVFKRDGANVVPVKLGKTIVTRYYPEPSEQLLNGLSDLYKRLN